MTPMMIAALADAEAAEPHRGLEYTPAGWRSTRPGAGVGEYHNFGSIAALRTGGYLELWGKGRTAVLHITEGGRAALATWRDRMARSAS
jgi:hypothetical protein